MKIKKGNHYPFPYFPIGWPKWVSQKKVTTMWKDVIFTSSCLYDLKNEDQHDVNKLFGFSIGCHHNTSFRFGWRPLFDLNQIEIVAYEYHDGVRTETISVGKVEVNRWYTYILNYFPDIQKTTYKIISITGVTKSVFHLKKSHGLGYTLGFYFGGNETAPQDVEIHTSIKDGL